MVLQWYGIYGTDPDHPSLPTFLTMFFSCTQLTLHDITLRRDRAPNDPEYQVVSANTREYTFNDLAPSTQYEIQIRAMTQAGGGDPVTRRYFTLPADQSKCEFDLMLFMRQTSADDRSKRFHDNTWHQYIQISTNMQSITTHILKNNVSINSANDTE